MGNWIESLARETLDKEATVTKRAGRGGAGIRQRSKWLLVSCGDFVSKSLVVFDFYMFVSPPHWSLFSLFFNPFETSSKKQQHTHRVRMLVRSLLPRTSPCRMGPSTSRHAGGWKLFRFFRLLFAMPQIWWVLFNFLCLHGWGGIIFLSWMGSVEELVRETYHP